MTGESFKLNQHLLEMMLREVPEDQAQRMRLPKCPHCHQRPTFTVRRGGLLQIETGLQPPGHPVEIIPAYEIIPCCSYRYKVTIEHLTRKQKLQAAHATQKS